MIQQAHASALITMALVGDGSSKLTNVFVSPTLSTNLIFVGQLVQINDWDDSFLYTLTLSPILNFHLNFLLVMLLELIIKDGIGILATLILILIYFVLFSILV